MLTFKAKATYDFVKHYLEVHGIAPTLVEVAAGIGFQSKGSTSKYISLLVQQGYLVRKKAKGLSRNIFLTDKVPYLGSCHVKQTIPLVGTIAAGSPIEAIAEHEPCDINEVLSGNQLFMLRVKGQSMIEEGIHDGDYIICEAVTHAVDGDIVVALIDEGEATLKRLYHKGAHVLLCPANSTMSPMEYEASRVRIQGKLKHSLRSH